MPAEYRIHLSKPASKSLKKIPWRYEERLSRAISLLEDDPFCGKKMRGGLKSQRRLKVWPYRIIYAVYENEKLVRVIEIEHRGSVHY